MNKQLPVLTLFVGSCLLFGVQPMMGRTLLPIFGGTAAVWTVCLCAFQTLLLGGYFYAHWLAGKGVKTQRSVHLGLLALSVLWICAVAVIRGSGFAPEMERMPAVSVLLCVLATIGLPYILLSANSSLIQAWVACAEHTRGSAKGQRNVYRLYAVSNLGSFAGLLLYPFAIEPYVSLTAQWFGFAGGMCLYAALVAWIQAGHVSSAEEKAAPAAPSSWRAVWFLLPALSVGVLNSVTTHLTLDVMPLPLLWVILLALFLFSYVVGFSERAVKALPVFGALALLSALLAALSFTIENGALMFLLNLAAGCGLIFFGCAFLHAWLFESRPEHASLTRFYLGNAAGGAAGGLLTGLVAPLACKTVAEYPLSVLLLMGALAGRALLRAKGGGGTPSLALARTVLPVCSTLIVAVVFCWRIWDPDTKGRMIAWRDRGFFGTLQVTSMPAATGSGAKGSLNEFIHGTTVHGMQARIPGKERMTTVYYTADAGGLAIVQHPKYKQGRPMKVGILGLGIGVLFGHCRPGDLYRAYEISPEALGVATNPAYFSFVADAPGKAELILGDARKGLEKEAAAKEPKYDVLLVDAFTGDNLPYHLSTEEAFKLYLDRLEPDGIIGVNISNWHLDLAPLVKAISSRFQIPVVIMKQNRDFSKLRFDSVWAFMMRQPPQDFMFPPDAQLMPLEGVGLMRLPTDEKGSFVSLVRWSL